MRYSQPYGTPQPPLGEYPRFINGNPVTGTEGSIPPATAFDENQIEIVTVIANAGLTPDHGDLTQLWQALQSLFAARYITTPITKTVHGPGADFPDLIAALQWVAGYTITPTGFVTFLVASGKWTYTTTVEISHRDAERIAIQGAPLLGASPTPPNLSVTGYHSATDGSAQITYLRSVYATELSFSGGAAGIRNFTNGAVLRYLLITGSQTIGPNVDDGCGLIVYQDLRIDGIAIWGFGDAGIRMYHASLRMATSLSLTIAYCAHYGLHNVGGAFLGATGSYVIIVSFGNVGLFHDGGWCWFGMLNIRGGNGGGGSGAAQLYAGAHTAVASGAVISLNNQSGVYVAGASTWQGRSSTYTQNTGNGIYMDGGKAWIDSSSFSGNGSTDVNVNYGANCYTVGASFATSSPALNTVGNGNAYIAH